MKSLKSNKDAGSSAIVFNHNGSATAVSEDLTNPANSTPLPVREKGQQAQDKIFINYAITNVTDSAYVQILASTTSTTQCLLLFDGGGYAMILAFGGSGSEVDKLYIPPGGFNGPIPFYIPASTRLSLKCLEAVTVNSGVAVINLLE